MWKFEGNRVDEVEEKKQWSGINGELLFHGGLLTWLALRGEALITAMSHFS